MKKIAEGKDTFQWPKKRLTFSSEPFLVLKRWTGCVPRLAASPRAGARRSLRMTNTRLREAACPWGSPTPYVKTTAFTPSTASVRAAVSKVRVLTAIWAMTVTIAARGS